MGRLLSYATQVAIARMYGPAQLGFYVLGTTVVYMVSILAQVGMDNGVVRYVAHYRAEGDVSRIRGTILLALSITLASSVGLASLMFFSAGFLGNTVFHEPFLETVFKAFAVSLPLFTTMNMVLYTTQGFQNVGYTTFVRQILQPLTNLVLIVIFYFLGAKILGSAASYSLSMAAGLILSLYYLKRVFPEILDRGVPTKLEPRTLFSASAPMIVANVMPYVSTWAAITVLGIVGTSAEVGIYNAAARTGTLSALVLFAFSGIFSPMASDLFKRNSLGHLGYLYKDISRWAFTGSLAFFLLTVLLAGDIMAVFGDKFASGESAMIVIAGAQLFSSSVGLTARVLAMTGRQKVVMIATVGSTVVGAAVTVPLIPAYGMLGAAVAEAAAIVISNAITLLAVQRLLGFWPYDASYLKPIAAGTIAAVGTYLANLSFPLSSGIPTILVFAPVFLISFAILLSVLGLNSSDRQFLKTFWMVAQNAIKRDARTASK